MIVGVDVVVVVVGDDDGGVEILEFVGVEGLSDDELGVGGIELFGDFGRGVERVGGGGGGAEKGSSHESEEKLRGVLEEDENDIALFDPNTREGGGGFAADEVGFREGVGFTGDAGDETGIIGEGGEVFKTVSVEREVVGDRNVRES